MPLFPSLPEPAHLADSHARFPANVRPLMAYTDGLLRSDGVLNIRERELIATHVSALDACTSHAGGHPAEGATPEEQAKSYSQVGDMAKKLAAG